jgi:hypothetical protein
MPAKKKTDAGDKFKNFHMMSVVTLNLLSNSLPIPVPPIFNFPAFYTAN